MDRGVGTQRGTVDRLRRRTGRDPLEAARAAGAPLVALTRQHLARERELNGYAVLGEGRGRRGGRHP